MAIFEVKKIQINQTFTNFYFGNYSKLYILTTPNVIVE